MGTAAKRALSRSRPAPGFGMAAAGCSKFINLYRERQSGLRRVDGSHASLREVPSIGYLALTSAAGASSRTIFRDARVRSIGDDFGSALRPGLITDSRRWRRDGATAGERAGTALPEPAPLRRNVRHGALLLDLLTDGMGFADMVAHDQASGWQVPQQPVSSAAVSRLSGCQDAGERAHLRSSLRAWLLVVRPPWLMPGAWIFCPLCRRWHSDGPSRECCRAVAWQAARLPRPGPGRASYGATIWVRAARQSG